MICQVSICLAVAIINLIINYYAPSRREVELQRAEENLGILRRGAIASRIPNEDLLQELSGSTGIDVATIRWLSSLSNDELRDDLTIRRIYFRRHDGKAALI